MNPDPEMVQVISSTFITITVLTTLPGALASIMLSTTIVNERTKGVYDLFLIRTVKKYELVLAKYFSVIICLVITILTILIVGMAFDTILGTTLDPLQVLYDNIESLVISAASLSISCSIGILFGMLLESVAAAAILSYYIGGSAFRDHNSSSSFSARIKYDGNSPINRDFNYGDNVILINFPI
ncbi:MAG: ABC-2 transporter permease [Candidatus Lokiarchaeota archaeon]|nr:ABC-2 transporter permease [Candidatus Lokiarchaeota archaeon]